MSQAIPAFGESIYRALRRTSRAIGAHPAATVALSITLVASVAILDYATGYEMRLAVLYTVPIALATWTGGARVGALASAAAVACWAIGFHPSHIYSHSGYYYWEALMLIVTFALFVLLLHHLRAALARADKRLLHVLDGLPAGICVTDESSGKLLYANRHFVRIVGSPVEERAPEFEQRLLAQVSGTPAAGERFQYREARDERSGHWFLIQSGTILWEDGQQVQLKVLTDVTDRKQAAAMRRQHQELLQNAARSAVLAEIASMLGHEINQPLMAIATYNDASIMLLNKEKPDLEEVIAALRKSRMQALRASDIVERTRSFLRRRAPSLECNDINQVTREAVQALELELQENGVQVDLQLGDRLPSLHFDATLIQQVIVNLLRNAIDAMHAADAARRKIAVRTFVGEQGELGVSVADCGPGIAETVAPHLFTPFFTTREHGLGLGLCICRSVIEAHAGTLSHAPAQQGGAEFLFTIPPETVHAEQA